MKKMIFMTALLAAVFTSCVDDEFDQPDIVIPTVDFDSNCSIANLKASYPGTLDSIEADTIIQGIVVANDESGNFYKTIVIQDATGGIELKIDRYDMYTEFKVGQRVYVKCRGLFLGDYGSLVQLGYIYNGEIGRIPDVMVDDHIFRDSLPGNAPAAALLTIPTLTTDYLSMLVQFDSVHFTEPGLTFSESTGTTNRTLEDESGNQILVRTSNYANFAADQIPDGIGSIRGILSVYNGDYQLYLRDINDIFNWDDPTSGDYVLYERFSTDPGWNSYSVASNEDWFYSSGYGTMAVSASGADVACDDYLISPALNLSGVANPIFTFSSWTRYTDGGLTQPFDVLISTNYSGSGDPTLATWTNLTATLPAADSQTWTSSGDINLSAYSGQTIYIAFRYRSSGTTSGAYSQWQIDEFKITK